MGIVTPPKYQEIIVMNLWDDFSKSQGVRMSTTILVSVFSLTFSDAIPELRVAGQLQPRSLTVEEVKEAKEMNITSLLDHNKTSHPEASTAVIEDVPLEHLPLGTNMEAAPVKDLVRMPGTKWCGIGWRADTVQQFGGYAGTDRCCRHHDLACPIQIEPGETKHGLWNHRYHTVMHCSCDDRFRSCLKMVDSQASSLVGNFFFNVGNTKCFVFKMEEVCEKRNWWGVCLKKGRRAKAVWRQPVAY